MASEWSMVSVAQLASGRRNALVGGPFGSNLVSADYVADGVPVIRGENLGGRWVAGPFAFVTPTKADYLRANLARPGDLVFTQRGTLGQVSLVPPGPYERYVLSQSQMKLTVDESIADPLFLYYVFASDSYQTYFRQHAIQTGVPHTNLSILRDAPVPLPPVKTQHEIAATLGGLDDKIELNRRMSQTFESVARAVFKSWFVDFDPVRAKAEGLDPGLPPHLAAMFPDSFEESELGEIPVGWHVTPFGAVLSQLGTGGRPKGGVSGYTSGVPSIGAESIVGLGRFDYSKTKYVPQEFFAAMSKGHVQSRDVLLYKDGGRPGEFEPHVTLFGDGFPFHTCAINEHVYRIRATDELGQNFLFFWLSSDLVMEEMRTKGTGVAIPGLNSTQVKSLTTLVPAATVVRAFNRLVEPLVAQVLATCNESHSLTELRTALLPRLLAPEAVVA